MKNILFIPSWYPTKENPLLGSFFKEQMLLLKKNNMFCILQYKMIKVDFLRYIFHIFIRKSFIKNYELDGVFTVETSLYILKNKIFNNLNKFLINQNDKKILSIFYSKNIHFDLIYAPSSQINGYDAHRFSKLIGIPYILSEHSPFPTVGTLLSDETKKSIEEADAFISISNDKTRQILMQNINIHPYLVGNFINEDKFSLRKIKENNKFNILIVAAFNFYKDYPTFFKAINELRTLTKKPFKITIVGYQPIKQICVWSKGEDAFINLLDFYKLKDICTLIPSVDRDSIASYYQQADVFVMTSIQEGFPVSALEAWACGVPVFSTRCGGVEDFLTDNSCGYLFNIQDYKSLAEKLNDYIEGRITFNSEEIRGKVIAMYGQEAFDKKMNAVFDSVLNNKN